MPRPTPPEDILQDLWTLDGAYVSASGFLTQGPGRVFFCLAMGGASPGTVQLRDGGPLGVVRFRAEVGAGERLSLPFGWPLFFSQSVYVELDQATASFVYSS